MKRLRSLLLNLVIMVVALAILVLILEVALALAGINTRSNIRYQPGKGITYLPGARYVHSKEGWSSGYFNEHGFRDRPRSWRKPAGVTRILVLGDSFAEGMTVPLEKTFAMRMEDELNRRAGRKRFEVLNLGQSGFGTGDAYHRYLDFGQRYDPDIVLLAFFSGNDIRNNHAPLNLNRPAFYYRLTSSGEIKADPSAWQAYEEGMTFWHRAFQTIKRQSYLASLVAERIYLLRQQKLRQRVQAETSEVMSSDSSASSMNMYSDDSVYRVPLSDDWEEALAITEGVLRLFNETVEKHGRQFVLVTFPSAEVVHPELQTPLRIRYGVDLDFDQPERRLAVIAERLGLSHLSLQSGFLVAYSRDGRPLHGFGDRRDGHWNQVGHALAAELILDFLDQQGIVPDDKESR